ncbi:glycosyltransferase family 2 protein [Bacillus smithii]|uniref:glycosyltransferase family 2 protein n=1 Tax=Bacillus smithii TaxID=1479 RepID=UPI0022E5990D|nr:glycosyltransferase family 2 protein [Bacillus smithii]
MKDVCAVVVTYNRKELLQECLEALLAQSCKVNKILVVDNASTDGTPEFVKSFFPEVHLLQLTSNIGGAGGFHEGIKWAYERGYDWIWVLDDDTITLNDTLEQLFKAYNEFPIEKKPHLLASKVIWSDNNLHPMNLPIINKSDFETIFLAASFSCVSLRASSFVSLLLHRKVIEQNGLPLKEYFIWNDDLEYTSRILKNGFGVLNPKSIVIHKTKSKYTPVESSGNRYYYEVRNKLWLLKTDSLFKKEKVKIFLSMLLNIFKYLKYNNYKFSSWVTILKGIKDGLFKYKKLVN